MQDFDYVLARSVDEVVSLLAADGDGACVLSGGTDLLIQLREGRRRAKLIVDIKGVPEVNEIIYHPSRGLSLGAAVPCWQICGHAEIARAYPGLLDAISLIGGVQIQGRATVGGNLCNASPAADSIPALIVHEALCVIALEGGGRREVPVANFCVAPGQTVLQRGEFLVSLRVPPPPPGFGAHYLRFTPRNEMDIAVVGAGASVVLDDSLNVIVSARIALGAVAPIPLFVRDAGEYLRGRTISAAVIAEAARIAQAAARPISDMRGTAAQRAHLSAVLTRRALEGAIARARGQRG